MRELCLELDTRIDEYTFDLSQGPFSFLSLDSWQNFKNLWYLELLNLEVDCNHLVEFLGRHKDCIKTLHLKSAWFGIEAGEWRQVLDSLEELTLDELRFTVLERNNLCTVVDVAGPAEALAVRAAIHDAQINGPVFLGHESRSDRRDHMRGRHGGSEDSDEYYDIDSDPTDEESIFWL